MCAVENVYEPLEEFYPGKPKPNDIILSNIIVYNVQSVLLNK